LPIAGWRLRPTPRHAGGDLAERRRGHAIEEAYNAIFRAESLLTPADHPVLIATIKEAKARLEKLRTAPPAGTS